MKIGSVLIFTRVDEGWGFGWVGVFVGGHDSCQQERLYIKQVRINK
jgi:hypothetical protein